MVATGGNIDCFTRLVSSVGCGAGGRGSCDPLGFNYRDGEASIGTSARVRLAAAGYSDIHMLKKDNFFGFAQILHTAHGPLIIHPAVFFDASHRGQKYFSINNCSSDLTQNLHTVSSRPLEIPA